MELSVQEIVTEIAMLIGGLWAVMTYVLGQIEKAETRLSRSVSTLEEDLRRYITKTSDNAKDNANLAHTRIDNTTVTVLDIWKELSRRGFKSV